MSNHQVGLYDGTKRSRVSEAAMIINGWQPPGERIILETLNKEVPS